MLAACLKSIDRRINNYIGLSDLKPALEERIRAEQIDVILRLTPAMMAGNLLISLVVVSQYLDQAKLPVVLVWAAAVLIMVSLAFQKWLQARSTGPRLKASSRATRKAALNAMILGSLWGVLPIITIFGDADAPERLMIAVIIAGMVCGGTFSLAAVPMAVVAFTLPIFVGSTATLWVSFDTTEQVVAVLLIVYAGILAAASLSSAKLLVGRIIATAESEDRGAVIAMLLREFEESASDWLWSTDADGRLGTVSERFAAAAGRPQNALQGMNLFDLFHGSGAEQLSEFSAIADMMRAGEAFRDIELPVICGDQRRWWKFSAQPKVDDAGRLSGYRGVASDVTEQKSAKDRVAYLAMHDDLTGLANRASFGESLADAIKQLESFEISFALLLIDLDQFKAVNDTRGHDIGDQLLIQIARRFAASLGGKDIVARLGGDEFAVIRPNPVDESETVALALTLIEAARVPIDVAGMPVSIGASVGIAVAPAHGTRADQLLRNADLALFRAKQGGRNTFRVFEIEMDRLAQEQRILQRQVSQALDQNQFELKYQPLIDVESNQVAGFEALVRWNHPDRGMVSPDVFIPVAEQTGAIKAIGDWVVREACMAAAGWPDDLTISVNLSARQFEGGRIIETVTDALRQSAINPKKLEIEITESVLIERPNDAVEMLKQLKALGVSIAIDDFGTGYSSLSYLWKFPFDKIKLDQSFVTAIEKDQIACDILKIIGSLGQMLNMRITAEGVETVEQADFLRTIACHQLQGFYFSRPLAAADLPAFLAENLDGRLRKGRKPKPGRQSA